jgi:hypothetical protein
VVSERAVTKYAQALSGVNELGGVVPSPR